MLFDDELKKNPNKKPIQTIKEKQV
jgi:hypothetical protein